MCTSSAHIANNKILYSQHEYKYREVTFDWEYPGGRIYCKPRGFISLVSSSADKPSLRGASLFMDIFFSYLHNFCKGPRIDPQPIMNCVARTVCLLQIDLLDFNIIFSARRSLFFYFFYFLVLVCNFISSTLSQL